ncbi:MAG: hypothetical protein ACE5FO_01270 [Parvularculaceae bacterium]
MSWLAALSALAAALPSTPAQTNDAERNPRYQDCIALLEEDQEIGRIAARQWYADGGGAPALHCLAVADLAAGFPKLAAVRLMELADRSDAGDDHVRARILSQAAKAWLEAGETEQAESALQAAFRHAPGSGELELTAAEVYAAGERWQDTADAVTRAEEAGFVSVKGFVLRARSLIALTDYHAAAEDVVRALKIDPFDIDALVLRGELQQRGVVINANYRRAGETDGEN